MAREAGTIHSDQGKYGFIKQDSGDDNMFVMPKACEAFRGRLPPVGTRVTYDIVADQKTGKARAEAVEPEMGSGKEDALDGFLATTQGGGEPLVRCFSADGPVGTMLLDHGKFGFIQQDSGEENMFVMPMGCAAFGGLLPPIGCRVSYDVVIDQKSGRPRADNVQPLEQALPGYLPAHPQGGINLRRSEPSGGDWKTGMLIKDSGKFGFIQQDSGEENMFVMPLTCEGFGGVLPPIGTRVIYTVVADPKTGRPRAEGVQPEQPAWHAPPQQSWAPPVQSWKGGASSWGPASKGSKGKGASMKSGPYGGSPKGGAKGGYFGAGMPMGFEQMPRQSGTMLSEHGHYGFIQQDSGEENMFVMPGACQALGGAFPPPGTRVSYDVVMDHKTGRARAENVEPGAITGTFIKDNGKFGFIQPDVGGENMFVMPAAFQEGQFPAVGTHVAYEVVGDQKTGRPRAENVHLA